MNIVELLYSRCQSADAFAEIDPDQYVISFNDVVEVLQIKGHIPPDVDKPQTLSEILAELDTIKTAKSKHL